MGGCTGRRGGAVMEKLRRLAANKWVWIAVAGALSPFALVFLVGLLLDSRWESELKAEIRRLEAGGFPMSCEALAPARVPDDENAATLYIKAFGQMEDRTEELRRVPWSERYDEARAREELKGIAGTLALFDEALKRPRARYEVDYSAGFEARLPYMPGALTACDSLVGAAKLEFRAGRVPEAVRHLHRALGVAESLREEPWLTAQEVRAGSVIRICRALIQADPDLSRGEWQDLAERLETVDFGRGFAAAIRMQQALGMQLVREYVLGSKAPRRLFKTGIGKQEAVRFLRALEKMGRFAGLPYHRAHKAEKKFEDTVRRKGGILARVMMPYVIKFHQGLAEAQAWARVAAALCRYRAGGKIEAPEDPFTGKPMILRSSAKTIRLYSVGPNLKDDGGVRTEDRVKDDPGFEVGRNGRGGG